ncbi:MAG: sialidase family protein, partial [Limisphaerales bacterium]
MRQKIVWFILLIFFLLGRTENSFGKNSPGSSSVKKIEDIVIYKEEKFYSAFPSIVRRPDGELLVAFRRAPNRRVWGEKDYTHTDPNSYLMLVRSKDSGKTWSQTPELIFAHPFGGSQDPGLIQLRNGSILCSSYGWALLPTEAIAKMTNIFHHQNFGFLGGFIVRSQDGGHSWGEAIIPPASRGEINLDPFGKPLPAYNRGAMCEGKDGRVFWAVASTISKNGKNQTHLMISPDHGTTWNYSCPIARDEKITFNETSLYETPLGDLVAFMRTEDFDDHTVIARSKNGGKSFEPWRDAGFQGHPHFALRLPDDRVLLVYGYRHAPFGIRARVLNSECTSIGSSPEIILRNDGGNGDLGYPWATL